MNTQIPVLNTHKFLTQFEAFKRSILISSGKPFVSFSGGLPYEWEHYKELIYHEGRKQLDFENWESTDIGSGSILRAAINAIEIVLPKEKNGHAQANNLVDWDLRRGPEKRSHRSLYKALEDQKEWTSYESLLFSLYRDDVSPAEVFTQFVERAGRIYDFVAYLFFLKDWSLFLPIAPTHFDRAFAMLDLNLKTTHRCSWENYNSFLSVMRQVRDELRKLGFDDARLVDAHSFCWMLEHPNLPKTPPERITPLPEALAISAAPRGEVKYAATEDEPRTTNWKQIRELQAELGRLAEDTVLESERTRLGLAGRSDLAERVRSVSDDHRKGYDIESFDEDEMPRLIEVKAARREKGVMSFFLSDNEWQRSQTLPNYFFYLVFDVRASSVSVRYFPASQLSSESLSAVVHTARIVEV